MTTSMKLTEAQINALRKAERRQWPAGEPRVSWFHAGTYAALTRMGLIEVRFPDVVHLTPAGRAAISGGNNG